MDLGRGLGEWREGEREGERERLLYSLSLLFLCQLQHACPPICCFLASRLNASPTLISGIWFSSSDSFSAVPRERRYARVLLKITWQKVFVKPEIWMWSLPRLDFFFGGGGLWALCVTEWEGSLWCCEGQKSHLATGTQTAMESCPIY